MIRLYAISNFDDEHKIIGNAADFATFFTLSKIYEMSDVGKFLQPTATELITPFFPNFRGVNVIESVIRTIDENENVTNFYYFYRVNSVEFSGINNLKFFIELDPFMTFYPKVTGYLTQSNNFSLYGNGIEVSLPVAAKPKNILTYNSNYLTGFSRDFWRVLVIVKTNAEVIPLVSISTFNSAALAYTSLTTDILLRNTANTVQQAGVAYEVVRAYIIPASFADSMMITPKLGIWSFGEQFNKDYNQFVSSSIKTILLTVDLRTYSDMYLGTQFARLKLPDYRKIDSTQARKTNYYNFVLHVSCETELLANIFVNGENVNIAPCYDVDLIYSPQSQYNTFNRLSDTIKNVGGIGATVLGTAGAAISQNYVATVSGIYTAGRQIAGLVADEIERSKKPVEVVEKAGNLAETAAYGNLNVFFAAESDIENKSNVDDIISKYGYIFKNYMSMTNYKFDNDKNEHYYKFSDIFEIKDDLTASPVLAKYYGIIRERLLTGVFIRNFSGT